MSKNLVVVESPAKCKTLKKYLGKDFDIFASYGHVRDLLPKSGAVETDNDFAMRYQLIDRNSKHVDAIAKSLKKADTLYLATDPDREGEAISWHLLEILNDRGLLEGKNVHRVAFYEITKKAVNEAVANPRELSMDLVNAQQARRALDYLVGFNLSPLLWKKIRRGLSAGRVQSPALRLIVEREIEIEKFNPQEYWTVEGDCDKDKTTFSAKLAEYDQAKLEQFSIENEKQAGAIRDWLLEATKGKLTVSNVEKKQRKRNPSAPFTTSTLQQEAIRKLGFSAQRAMRVAQGLYEGLNIGEEGEVGLITYMRTDSVTLSDDAVVEIREYVAKTYGADHLPDQPRVFKTKSKNAQEAHEAIRPTSAMRTPDSMKQYLDNDQIKLYTLIWKRTVACQMIHATLNTVAVDFAVEESARFRANGSTIANPGFIRLYQEGKDDAKGDDDEKMLPVMEIGDVVNLHDIRADQHFTEPPPRYTEASLVKALEEFGIGRPSTYASIISTLQNREYVKLDKKRFSPTDVGRIVNKFLTNYFTQYVDYDFTANLEDELDAVSRGEEHWVPLLQKFWTPFAGLIGDVDEKVKRSDVTTEETDEKCPECEKPLVIRLGRSGRFYGCTGYPDCSYTRSLETDDDEEGQAETLEGRKCPKCENELEIKAGKYGKFIGCKSYPDCKHMEPLVKPKDTGVTCPECHSGQMMERKSRRGKVFFSCARYPKCEYASWNQPLKEPCPECRWPMLTLKITKSKGAQKICPQQNCSYCVKAEDLDKEK